MTENRKIQIPVQVDATQAKEGFKEIKESGRDMALTLQQESEKARRGLDGMVPPDGKLSKRIEQETSRIAQALQKSTLALESGGKATSKYFEGIARLKGADMESLQPFITKLREAEERTAAAQAKLNGVSTSLNNVGMSAKQTANALRGVPAQFTDIVTSIAAGQAPLTVLLQQGGQLKDMFGGAGNAARALGGYIASLINPYTLLAAAVGASAFAYYKGAQEAQEYAKAIILSGNAAGVTSGQLSGYAANIAKISGTQAKAAETLAEFVSSGRVGRENLEAFSLAAIRFESATGTAVSKTVEKFAELGKSPVDASVKLNEQMNFLTVSVYKQIKALEEQGKMTEAADLAQKSFADSIGTRSTQVLQNLGAIETAWKGITNAIKAAGDAWLNLGRAETPADRLSKIQERIKQLQTQPGFYSENSDGAAFGTGRNNRRASADQAELARLQAESAALQGAAFQTQEIARAEAERAKQVQARIAFDKNGEEFLSKQAKLEREITKAKNEGLAAGATELEIQTRIAGIREKYKESGVAGTGQNEVAAIRATTLARKQYLDLLISQGAQAEKLTEGEKLVLKIQEELKTSITGVARAQKEKALAAAQEQAAVDKQVVNEEKRIKALKDFQATLLKQIDVEAKAGDAIEQRAKDQEAANAVLGKGQAAIEAARLAQMRLNFAQIDASENVDPAYIAALQRKIDAQQRYADALQQAEIRAYGLKQAEETRVNSETSKTLELELSLVGQTAEVREIILARRRAEVKLAKELAEIDKINASTPEDEAEKERLRAQARSNAAVEANNEATRAILDNWQRTSDQINQSLTDALLRGFESGKGFAENLRDTIVNMFKTLVLRPIISAVMAPVSGAISGFVGGALGLSAGSAAAASGGSNALGALGAAGSFANLAGGFGGGIMNGLSAWGAGGSVGGVFSNPGLYSGAELLGAGLPILAGVGALFALANATKGETRAGGQYGYGINGAGVSNRRGTTYSDVNGAFFLEGPSGGDPYQAQAMKGIDDTVSAINARFKGLGSSASVVNFNAGYESSGKDRGGVFAGGALSGGRTFGETGQGDNYSGTLFETTSTQSPDAATAVKNFATDLLQVSIQALQAEDGLPRVIRDILQINGKDIVAENLTDEAAADILKQVDTVIAGVNSLTAAAKLLPFEDLANLSFDAAAGLIELAGGIQALGSNLTSFYQTYFTPEEQQAQTRKNVTATLNAVGVDLPATRDEFKELVLQFMALGEAGQPALAALLSVNQAFASITQSAEEAAAALKAQDDAAKQAAFSALQQAAQVERGLLDARRDVLSQSISDRQSLAGVLGSNVRELRSQAAPEALATNGKEFIAQALATAKATGYLPDTDLLSNAISGARGGISEGAYGSKFEQDRDRLVLAGQLSQLEEINGKQLTFEEQQLKAVELQVKALEETVEFWRQQIDLSTQGIEATLSVADAVDALKKLMFPDKKTPPPSSTGPAASQGGAVFGGGGSSVDPGVVDENGLRTYADGSTQQLTENEFYLWKKFKNTPIPYFDVGTNRVPHDMLAMLHKDEAVIPKAFNPYLGGGDMGNSELASAVDRLTAQNAILTARLEAIEGNTAGMPQMSRQFNQYTNGGQFSRQKEIA